MNSVDFKDLKNGDKVIFSNDSFNILGDLPPVGTVLTRKKNWLDDDHTIFFEYEVDGVSDGHFFGSFEVEVVNE